MQVLFLFSVTLWLLLRGVSCLSLALLFVLVFLVILALWSPCSRQRELIYVFLLHLFVYFARVDLNFFSSSWCHGLAATSDCDTSWTFLLTVF